MGEIKAEELKSNILAGITVGIVALPLSMALAIASGVAPQYGLYTAIVAGIVIAFSGSSRVNISGPTAAFVVILLPIVHQFGLGGLLISGLMAGVILIVMGFCRLGSLIELVPYPVTVGFTSGIAVVIATIQIKDFFGLQVESLHGSYIEELNVLLLAFPSIQWQELLTAVTTLAVLLLWNRTSSRIPSHLVALFVGSLFAWAANQFSDTFSVHTIASTFHYSLDGLIGDGIPPMLPQPGWPWDKPDATGQPIGLSLGLIYSLTGAAFAIALLGAIESLLCAVISDSMAGTRTDPNRELIGQGIGNIITPFLGGIPATAAIARTATNIRSGGTMPMASVIHAIVILLSILLLTTLLGHIPMASMAALLMVVAWNMSEAKHFIRIIRVAPRDDVLVLLTCFLLTVLMDMEVAVAVGMALAAILFIRRTIELTGIQLISNREQQLDIDIPDEIIVYVINGPMFFGAAQNALKTLTNVRHEIKVIVIDMQDVSMMDMTAIVAMGSIIEAMDKRDIGIVFSGISGRIQRKLEKAEVLRKDSQHGLADSLENAIELARFRLQ